MNYFGVFAHGEEFDVDAFLATTILRPDVVWRRGEQQRHACFESRHATAGVEFTLGDGRSIPLPEQQRIAVSYLSANRDALKDLAARPGVTVFVLGLQYHIVLEPDVIGFCMGPSTRLMRQALDIGVSPTFYVSLDRSLEFAAALRD
jgi:hypothetical protein